MEQSNRFTRSQNTTEDRNSSDAVQTEPTKKTNCNCFGLGTLWNKCFGKSKEEDAKQARLRQLVSGINKTTQEAQYVSNEVGLLQEGTRNLQTQQARADTRVNTLSLARQEYQNGILQQQQQHTQKMTHPMY